jgi:SAM-dependent methyltransferase
MSTVSRPHDDAIHGVDAGYDEAFYDSIEAHARDSAAVVVPLLLDLTHGYPIHSVVDVGCGLGTWLATFADHGITDVVGLESDHLPPDRLRIPADRLVVADLSAPPDLGRRFDLAISLEVAEHLPPEAADRFVAFLCRLAPVVLFSAAIPGQRGVHHVNEQWPGYWAERFAAHGYEPRDWVRPRVWDDERVVWWYAQNTILYVSSSVADQAPWSSERGPTAPARLVHPVLFAQIEESERRAADAASHPSAAAPDEPDEPGEPPAAGPATLRSLVRQLPGATGRAVVNRSRQLGTAATRWARRRSGR